MEPAVIGSVAQWVGAVGTIIVVGYALYRDLLKRPKLLVSFDNDRDVKSQLRTVGLDPSLRSRWLRVRVQNAKGRRAAKNCRAFVIGIEKVVPGAKGEDVFPNDVRQLVWTHDPTGSPSARDLLPGVANWVDVVAAFDEMSSASPHPPRPEAADIYGGPPPLFVRSHPPYALENPGVYVFTIQVSAEDAKPEVIKVEVHWDGTWQSLSGQQVR